MTEVAEQRTLISRQDYARSRKARGLSGGTWKAIDKAIKAGRITATENGMIDPLLADEEWQRNTRRRIDYKMAPTEPLPSTALQSAPSAIPADSAAQTKPISYADSKARTEAATAELREMELAEKKGELIDRAGHERAATVTARTLRDQLVNTLPTVLSQELATITDPWSIECKLRGAIRDTLTAICDQLEALTDG